MEMVPRARVRSLNPEKGLTCLTLFLLRRKKGGPCGAIVPVVLALGFVSQAFVG